MGTPSVLLLLVSLLLPLECNASVLEVLELPASGEDDHSSGGGCRLAADGGKRGEVLLLLLWSTWSATVAIVFCVKLPRAVVFLPGHKYRPDCWLLRTTLGLKRVRADSRLCEREKESVVG